MEGLNFSVSKHQIIEERTNVNTKSTGKLPPV